MSLTRRMEIWADGTKFRVISVWRDEESSIDIVLNWGDLGPSIGPVERWLRSFGREAILGLTDLNEHWEKGLTVEQAREKVTRLRKSAKRAGMRRV